MTMERVTPASSSASGTVRIDTSGNLRWGEAVADRHGLPEEGRMNVYADRERDAIGLTLASESTEGTYSVSGACVAVRRPIKKAGRQLPDSATMVKHWLEDGMFVVDVSNLPEQQTIVTEYQDTL